MGPAGIDRIDQSPIADEHFLACAETVFAATHRAEPWNYPEPVMAGALARFRRDLALPGTAASSLWHLPQGLRPPPPSRERKEWNPTRQPGAFIVMLLCGHLITGDAGTGSLRDFARPSPDGPACLIRLCGWSRRPMELQVRFLMHRLDVERGFLLLPEGAEPPAFLPVLGWRKERQVADELTGLSLDVHGGSR
ncbi:hypothetical protein SAMN05444920_102669 [Nonomuraea solani]|uniref:Uncharacterized protein n=2 Tax=Nonomuraea solani TaxID=1144553 RepID=A0A1H5ZGP1_9ACTN|nr:hypothetical protein SAMN05444920_102669 [Nonomuraea solani]